MGIISYQFIIHGTVQGVGYRYYTKQKADELKLVGWVKNRHDGCVEITAQGTQTALDTFEQWVNHGPSYAKVSKVERQHLTTNADFNHFEIR